MINEAYLQIVLDSMRLLAVGLMLGFFIGWLVFA